MSHCYENIHDLVHRVPAFNLEINSEQNPFGQEFIFVVFFLLIDECHDYEIIQSQQVLQFYIPFQISWYSETEASFRETTSFSVPIVSHLYRDIDKDMHRDIDIYSIPPKECQFLSLITNKVYMYNWDAFTKITTSIHSPYIPYCYMGFVSR